MFASIPFWSHDPVKKKKYKGSQQNHKSKKGKQHHDPTPPIEKIYKNQQVKCGLRKVRSSILHKKYTVGNYRYKSNLVSIVLLNAMYNGHFHCYWSFMAKLLTRFWLF